MGLQFAPLGAVRTLEQRLGDDGTLELEVAVQRGLVIVGLAAVGADKVLGAAGLEEPLTSGQKNENTMGYKY